MIKEELEKEFQNIYNESFEGHKIKDRYDFQGLTISIEYKKGTYRSGEDKHGNKWKRKMKCDYGYILKTEAPDGDHVDCYIKDKNSKSDKVYIIKQNDPETKKFDENKVMLGFDNREDAIKAYKAHYDKPSYFGSCITMDFEDFKDFILNKKNFGKEIKK